MLLAKDYETRLNIEFKGPYDANLKLSYDYKFACKTVCDLVIAFELADRVMMSSFQTEIVEELISLRTKTDFIIHSLKEPED